MSLFAIPALQAALAARKPHLPLQIVLANMVLKSKSIN